MTYDPLDPDVIMDLENREAFLTAYLASAKSVVLKVAPRTEESRWLLHRDRTCLAVPTANLLACILGFPLPFDREPGPSAPPKKLNLGGVLDWVRRAQRGDLEVASQRRVQDR